MNKSETTPKPKLKSNLADILDILPNAILILDKEGYMIYANIAAQDFFSASSTVLAKRKLDFFFTEDSPLMALVAYVQDNLMSVNEYQVELSSSRLEAKTIVDLFLSPLMESEGEVVLMIQKRMMAQKIERQIAHQGVAKSVSGMAAILAHEIKNPLSGIRGAAQLLESGVSDEDKALTQLVCTETDRICNLVDQMEEFGEPRVDLFKEVNIHSVLEHVKKVAEAGSARHVRIREEYDPSLPPILGDHDRLVQAFLNLVKNAAEAIEPQRKTGVIVLRSAYRPGVRMAVSGTQAKVSLPIEIQIEDNGGGINDEVKQHLFDPFITNKPTGKGLGLALVAKITADHGGTIEFESNADKTIFKLLFPANKSDIPKA